MIETFTTTRITCDECPTIFERQGWDISDADEFENKIADKAAEKGWKMDYDAEETYLCPKCAK